MTFSSRVMLAAFSFLNNFDLICYYIKKFQTSIAGKCFKIPTIGWQFFCYKQLTLCNEVIFPFSTWKVDMLFNINCNNAALLNLLKHVLYPPIKYFQNTVQPSCRRRSAHRAASHQCPLLLHQSFFHAFLFLIIALNPLDLWQRMARSALLHIFSICRLDSQITFILSPLSVSRNLFNNNNRRQWRFISKKIRCIFKL